MAVQKFVLMKRALRFRPGELTPRPLFFLLCISSNFTGQEDNLSVALTVSTLVGDLVEKLVVSTTTVLAVLKAGTRGRKWVDLLADGLVEWWVT